MVTYLYHIFGEETKEDYKKMWNKSNNLQRVFPISLLIEQTFFSIQTLRLFDKESSIIIFTNKPEHPLFQKFEKNIKLINVKNEYESIKHEEFWCYFLRIETLYKYIYEIDDDIITLDCDTYFKIPWSKSPTELLNIKRKKMLEDLWTCLIYQHRNKQFDKDTEQFYNMGVVGLNKKDKNKFIRLWYQRMLIQQYLTPKQRAIDEIVLNQLIKKYNYYPIETCDVIEHYWQPSNPLKYSIPPESLFEQIKKKNNHIQ